MISRSELAKVLGAGIRPDLEVKLPSSERSVVVQVLLRRETRHSEPVARSSNCWAPNKPSIDFRGAPSFAEFVVVRLLEDAGWSARWIKNWAGGREFCSDVGCPQDLDAGAAQMFKAIHSHASALQGAGSWDVCAWKGRSYLFLESKQRGSDRLNHNQRAWLEAAIDVGVDPESFAVVEYDAPGNQSASPRAKRSEATPRIKRMPATPAVPTALTKLLRDAAHADPMSRIEYRNQIAAFGEHAVNQLSTWLDDTALRRFAIVTLGQISLSSPTAREVLASYEGTGGPDADLAAASVARKSSARAVTGQSAASVPQTRSSYGGRPPPAQGPCSVPNRDGTPCNNPGRWPVPQDWSCTTHIKAISRRDGS